MHVHLCMQEVSGSQPGANHLYSGFYSFRVDKMSRGQYVVGDLYKRLQPVAHTTRRHSLAVGVCTLEVHNSILHVLEMVVM